MKKKIIILLIIAIILIGIGVAAYWFFVVQSNSDSSQNSDTTVSQAEKPASNKDVVALAAENATLSTFSDVLAPTSLNDTLKGDGPYTVLAPSNAAFAALPSGTLERLQKPESASILADIINYHVIPGSLLSSDITDGQKIKTLNGQEVVASVQGTNIYFTDAKGQKALVTKSDIKAKNGVIHIINGVLLPQ